MRTKAPYQTRSTWRALIAAIAIYGFLLQGFALALVEPAAAGVTCFVHKNSSGPLPLDQAAHHDCCKAMCPGHAGGAAPPLAMSGLVEAPQRIEGRIDWLVASASEPDPVPAAAFRARGPPAV
jgi:hypothetical protein